jgi:hypothetical protein
MLQDGFQACDRLGILFALGFLPSDLQSGTLPRTVQVIAGSNEPVLEQARVIPPEAVEKRSSIRVDRITPVTPGDGFLETVGIGRRHATNAAILDLERVRVRRSPATVEERSEILLGLGLFLLGPE